MIGLMFTPTPATLLRWATLYLVTGIAIGIYMSITQDFAIIPVHAHINLIGWVSLSLAALIYKAYPAAGASPLATAHFWLQIPALPLLTGTLYFYLRGNTALDPLLGIGSLAILGGVVALALNVFRNVRD